MAVRWPDGSYTGSLRLSDVATPVEPEPEKEPETQEPVKPVEKKEAGHVAR